MEPTESRTHGSAPPRNVEEALARLAVIPDAWVAGLTKLCTPDGPHSHGGEPCTTPGKRPLLKRFNDDAATRFARYARGKLDVEAWRRTAAGWLVAGCNVGLVPPPGVVVLDCDTEAAVEWVAGWLEGLERVPCQTRGVEKAHFWLRYDPEELPLRAKQLRLTGPGGGAIALDLRVGGRSQAVVAPSRHPRAIGGEEPDYAWLEPLPDAGPGVGPSDDLLPWVPTELAGALRGLLGPDPMASPRVLTDADPLGLGELDGVSRVDGAAGHDLLLGYVNRICRYASVGDRRGGAEGAPASLREKAVRYARELYDRPGGEARLAGILREGGELDRMLASGWARFGGLTPLGEDRTDQGYLETLEATWGRRWMWVSERASWLVWSDEAGAWRPVPAEMVGRAVGDMHATLHDDAARESNKDRRDRLFAMAKALRQNARVESVLRRAQKAYGVSETDLDAGRWLLAFPGSAGTGANADRAGVPPVTLDLDTMTAKRSDPADRITRVMAVPYQPGARSERWERFLAETFPGPEGAETLAFLARAAGMTLAGVTLEHVLMFMHGPGGTGKSTFLGALGAALGDYAIRADFRTFVEPRAGAGGGGGGASPDIARMHGARMVICSEIPDRARLGARMKDLTGGDRLLGRPLYGRPFEFTPQHTVWCAGNVEPAADYMDSGVWRRMRQVPVTRVCRAPDPRLPAELGRGSALAAVAQWALEGWVAYREAGRLGSCAAVDEATSAYRARLDPIGEWWRDRVERGPGFEVPCGEAYSDYCQYMGEHYGGATRGEAPRASQRQFGALLKELGVDTRKGGKGIRLFVGLKLRERDSGFPGVSLGRSL